jgi:hypothetical protein
MKSPYGDDLQTSYIGIKFQLKEGWALQQLKRIEESIIVCKQIIDSLRVDGVMSNEEFRVMLVEALALQGVNHVQIGWSTELAEIARDLTIFGETNDQLVKINIFRIKFELSLLDQA